MRWDVVYKKAINQDGTLYFKEKLSHEFLETAKRTMGSYLFANQYLNEIIPAERQTFKREWFEYFESIPEKSNTFVFFDPALSEADTSDYTGVVICSVDHQSQWYVQYAKRHRVNPSELIDLIFQINAEFKPLCIGIEEVAYQKVLLYMLDEEMKVRNQILPVKGIRPPNDKSKQMRIMSLVPRFEWGRLFLNRGLSDLELELLQFPRGKHDDLIDALAAIEYIYMSSEKPPEKLEKPNSPNDPNYEKWVIQNLHQRSSEDV